MRPGVQGPSSFETPRYAWLLRMRCGVDVHHRPHSLRPREGRRPSRSPLKEPRARGTPRVLTDPRTSTPRDIEVCRNPVPAFALARYDGQAASPPNPRRPARGVFRFAPPRPRWTSRFRHPALLTDAYPPLRAQTVPSTSDRAGCRRQWGPATRGWRAGTKRLGPPGVYGAASPTPRPGHRSPPRVWRR